MLLYNDDLRTAHQLKEWFYDICQSIKYSYQRMAFWEWVKFAEKSGIPEFENCARTYRNWSEGNLNAFKYGFTNGPTDTELRILKGSVPELYTALSDKKGRRTRGLFVVLKNINYRTKY
jgi:transposase